MALKFVNGKLQEVPKGELWKNIRFWPNRPEFHQQEQLAQRRWNNGSDTGRIPQYR